MGLSLSPEEQQYYQGYADGQREASMKFRQRLLLIKGQAIDGILNKSQLITEIEKIIHESLES